MLDLNIGNHIHKISVSTESSFQKHNQQMKDFRDQHNEKTVFDENDHFEPEIMEGTKPLRVHPTGIEMSKAKHHQRRADHDILVCASKVSGQSFKKN